MSTCYLASNISARAKAHSWAPRRSTPTAQRPRRSSTLHSFARLGPQPFTSFRFAAAPILHSGCTTMPWPNFSSSQKRKRSSSGFNPYAYANYRRRIHNERTPSSSSRSQPSTSSCSSQGSRKSHSSTSRTAQSSTPSQSFRSSQSSQPSQSTRVDEFGDDSVFDHIECIDLTGDTPSTSFVSSQNSTQSPSLQRAPQPRASQSLRVDEFGDESVFDDIVDQSQVSNERAFEQNILYGVFAAAAVALPAKAMQESCLRKSWASATTMAMPILERW